MQEYIKMSALVDNQFTVQKVGGYVWKAYIDGKFETSELYKEGYQKRYAMETDKGKLEVSSAQLASMLEAVQYQGVADLNGKSIKVKSNGKEGKDIRYFFSMAKGPSVGLDPALKQKLDEKAAQTLYPQTRDLPPALDPDEPINLDDIPF
jgi:hypothetical protein